MVEYHAGYIWVDTDLNKHEVLIDADPVFIASEMTFCSFFTLELTVRFMAFQRKCNALKDSWFAFDLALVFLMVLETWTAPTRLKRYLLHLGYIFSRLLHEP